MVKAEKLTTKGYADALRIVVGEIDKNAEKIIGDIDGVAGIRILIDIEPLKICDYVVEKTIQVKEAAIL
ncbi:MAG: hypothetical protein PVJ60_04430 [Phycisphaerales bacterium]|jgi:hypothetical protein